MSRARPGCRCCRGRARDRSCRTPVRGWRRSRGRGRSHASWRGAYRGRYRPSSAATASTVSGRRASAQGRTPRPGGTLISAKTTEAPSLEPVLEQALGRIRLDPIFYNRLVEWSADGKLVPALAESWTTSADGKVWTFKLRRGVKFHNGREFVAADAKYSFERVLDPNGSSGGRGYLSAIDGMETPDKNTLVVHTKQPSASLLAGMAGGWSSIIPKEVVEEKGDLRRTAVGTGPFIFQEWVPQSHLKARKNPDYWDKGKPYIDALELKVIPDEANIIAQLRTGNVHHALLEDNKNYLLVKDDKRLTALRAPRLGFDMVNINHGRRPYTDVRVRQALSLAVDRTEVLQAAAAGLGSVTGPLTPAMRPWALPADAFKEWYTPNLERAKKLLADAGYPSGFKTTLKVIPTFPTMVAGAQVIAAQEDRRRRADHPGGVRRLDQGHHQAELRLRPDDEPYHRRRRSRLALLPAVPLLREAVEQRRRPRRRRAARPGADDPRSRQAQGRL